MVRETSIVFAFFVLVILFTKQAETTAQEGTLSATQRNDEIIQLRNAAELGNTNANPSGYNSKDKLIMPYLIHISGMMVGILIVLYQINRQHKNQLKLQQDNNRQQLMLELYSEFTKVSDKAGNSTIETGMYAFSVPSHLSLNMSVRELASKQGFKPKPVDKRSAVFSSKHYDAISSLIEVTSLCEKYLIIHPELMEVFKLAILSAIHDLGIAYSPLLDNLCTTLPIDIQGESGLPQTVNIIELSKNQISELRQLTDIYHKETVTIQCYLYDLNTELQKLLLSGLFPNVLKNRKPIDPSMKVITSDPENMRKLKKYFEDESPRGKDNANIRNITASKFMYSE